MVGFGASSEGRTSFFTSRTLDPEVNYIGVSNSLKTLKGKIYIAVLLRHLKNHQAKDKT